jgi:hypothetical protein
MKRRKFLDHFFRWTMAGGLSSIGGFLAFRGQLTRFEDCSYLPTCTHCTLFDGCNKPAKNRRLKNGKEYKK